MLSNNVPHDKAPQCGYSEHQEVLPLLTPPVSTRGAGYATMWLSLTFPDWWNCFQVIGCIQRLKEVDDIFRTWIEKLRKEESLQWTVTVPFLRSKAWKLAYSKIHLPKGAFLCTISTQHQFVPSYTTVKRILTYRKEKMLVQYQLDHLNQRWCQQMIVLWSYLCRTSWKFHCTTTILSTIKTSSDILGGRTLQWH